MVAKAILFKTADCIYGTKNDQDCIGDLKKMVVPYTIALLKLLTEGKIDLYRIWTHQCGSTGMEELLKKMMKDINDFILKKSPMARFQEWGKKEECWEAISTYNWSFPMYKIKSDLIVTSRKNNRKSINKTDDEKADAQYKKQYKSII